MPPSKTNGPMTMTAAAKMRVIRVSAGSPPAHSKMVGSRSGSGTGSLNSTYQCMPLQNGLFCECPHRHSA